ncbi:MAG: aldo/keto reductase [Candidatus Sumerlaeota bacterium]
MRSVKLGNTNLNVTPFCLGTMMFGGKTDAAESDKVIRGAIDGGVNFIDTADMYTGGDSEKIIGKTLKESGLRDRVVLASKGAIKIGDGLNDVGASRYHLVRALEGSLERLQTDRIDIYYIHWPQEAMNLEETLRTLDDMVRQGKILYPACSNFPAWLAVEAKRIADLGGYAPFVCGQYPYNLIERGLDVEVLPMAKALGFGITCYRPLCLGTLTGKYLDGVPESARGQKDERAVNWSEKYAEGIAKMKTFAEERGYTAADAANAWVASHPYVTSPIVGVSRMEQLEKNLKGFEWEMTAEEREEISSFFPTEVWEEGGGQFPNWRRRYDIK